MYDEPEADWSVDELEVLTDLFAEHVRRSRVSDWRSHPGFRAVCRDMEDYRLPIPKWGCLVGWLAPEGPVAALPELVTDIARRALDGRLAG
jgi:hypothetical protein